MILHLLNESNFDSLIINQFEECTPGDNLFLLFPGNRSSNIIRSDSGENILYLNDKTLIDFNEIEGIIIHYLCIPKAKFLLSIPKNIPIACSFWGGDFYNFLPEFKQNLYGAFTRKYLTHSRKRPWFYLKLKDSLHFPFSRNYKLWRKTVQNSKIYSTVIPYERNLIGKYFNSRAEYMPLPTHSLDKVVNITDYENTICTKEKVHHNILLGNSGNLTNNHLEILQYFTNFSDNGINVHLPLTYGDDQYIKHLCKVGYSILGEKFHPLLNHLNYKDYFNYINAFNICIFNNYRQQGVGTINLALWSGGKVFLSNKNVTLSYYKECGLNIFSIEDDFIAVNNTELFTSLTYDEILVNRNCLLKMYSNEIVRNSLIKFTERLKSFSFIS